MGRTYRTTGAAGRCRAAALIAEILNVEYDLLYNSGELAYPSTSAAVNAFSVLASSLSRSILHSRHWIVKGGGWLEAMTSRIGRKPVLIIAALLGIGIIIGRGSSTSQSEAPRGEPLTVTENDMACLDKEFVRAAAKQPLRWQEQDGRVRFFYTRPFFEVNKDLFFNYDESKACIRLIEFSPFGAKAPDFVTLKIPAKLTIIERDGDIACVVGNALPAWPKPHPDYKPPPKGQCYWMILRPPSERAGPKPETAPGVR